jgi:hypothetical protein
MAVWNDYIVQYYYGDVDVYDPSAWATIDDVQDLSCFVGRQTSVDQWSVSSCSIRARYPNGFASPLVSLQADTWLRWFAPNSTFDPDTDTFNPAWVGLIKNVRLDIGIPWDSGNDVGVSDYLIIEAEGSLSRWGRFSGQLPIIVSPSFKSTMDELNDFYDLTGFRNEVYVPEVGLAEINYDDQQQYVFSQWLFEATNGMLAIVCDGVPYQNDFATSLTAQFGEPSTSIFPQSSVEISDVSFSDTTNDSSHRVFQQIEFEGLADTFYNEINVTSQQGGSATAKLPSLNLLSTYRTLGVSTLNVDEGDCQALADSLLNKYSVTDVKVSRLVAVASAQDTQNLNNLDITDLPFGFLSRFRVQIDVRGETFYGQIEGVQLSATPTDSVFTYYLTGVESLADFTLDSAEYGELDDDRLAFL